MERTFFEIAFGIFCACFGLIFCLEQFSETSKLIISMGLIVSLFFGIHSFLKILSEVKKRKIAKTRLIKKLDEILGKVEK